LTRDQRLEVETEVDFGLGIGERRAVIASPVTSEISQDAGLVSAAREGDRGAFGALYDRYGRMVHGILLARVPADDVDDLVHDVFLLALQRLPGLRETAAFGGWLATIARNRAHDYHRRGRDNTADRAADMAEGAFEEAASRGTGTGASQADALAVLAALRTLPDAYRETLVLRLVEGMTGPEIAARTGLTPGSVRVNLGRGMQQLREKLGITAAAAADDRREKEAP